LKTPSSGSGRLTLGIDTSSAVSYVSIARGSTLLASVSAEELGSAEVLTELIAKACESADIALKDLELIGVCLGPGSFTGLRTGLATASGLRFALAIPVIGVSAFIARLYPEFADGRTLVGYLRASRAEQFWSSVTVRREGEMWAVSVPDSGSAVSDESLDEAISSKRPNAQRVMIEPENCGSTSGSLSRSPSDCVALAVQCTRGSAPDCQEGDALVPLYVKPVNAKTLAERGAQNNR